MIRNAITPALVTLLAVSLAGCGDSGTGTVRVTASDSAALRQALGPIALEEFETICLDVVGVRVKVHAVEDHEASGWHDLRIAPDRVGRTDENLGDDTKREPEDACPLDLAALLRGEKVKLAWGEVPAGDITELRFVLGGDQGYARRLGETAEIPVLVPSGSQSGLKFKFKGGRIHVEPDEEQEITLVFDAKASIREHDADAVRVRPVVHVHGAETVYEDDKKPNGPLQ